MEIKRAALYLFALGATVGTALDALHTYSGTTAYTAEVFFRAAWWTPLLFGGAGVLAGLSYVLTERATGRLVAPLPTPGRTAAAFALFAGLYAVSGYWVASNAAKLAVLAGGGILLGLVVARTSLAFGIALVTALTGPVVEIILVRAGVFRHLQPDVLGLPIWLPALYAAASFALGILGKRIVAGGEVVIAAATITPSSGA